MKRFVWTIFISVLLLNSLVFSRNKVAREREEEEKRQRQREAKELYDMFSGGDPYVVSIKWATPFFHEARSHSIDRFHQWLRKQRREEEIGAVASFLSGIVNEAVGKFRQVNTVGEPIYKHVSGGTWGMRQISTHGEALFKPSFFGKTFKFFGMAAKYGTLAIDVVNLRNAAAKDLELGTVVNTVCSGTKAVGSFYGATYGASIGAAALSFVPVVGPLIGGVVGGFAGTHLGSVAGGLTAEWMILASC